jgi:hypothetical protein
MSRTDWLPDVWTKETLYAAITDPRLTQEVCDEISQRINAENEQLVAEINAMLGGRYIH